MFKLPHSCTHLTCYQSNAQNSTSQASTYVNHEVPDVQAGFREGRATRAQIVNICWIIEKTREFQNKVYFCFIDYAKNFDCVDHNKLWKILQEMGIPGQFTCLLRNLYAGQEATELYMESRLFANWEKSISRLYIVTLYCNPAYLTNMQSTSCEMPGWMKQSWNQDCQEKYQ